MINNKLIIISLLLPFILVLLLFAYPEVDLSFSQLFWDSEYKFVYRNNIFVWWLYISIPFITKFFVLVCFCYIALRSIRLCRTKSVMLSSVVYLIITAAVGPGIIVNYVLKENFGRARPSQIIEFGGQKTFTPAFIVSDQCLTNCSFSSGHASMAIYFTAIAYAFALRSKNHKTNVASSSRFTIIYLLGCLFGIMVGMSRILMGGHFLSDVAFSCFITLLVNYLLFLWWKKLKLKS